jgi:hypothetical protein
MVKEHLYCYTPAEMAAFVEGGAAPDSRAVFENHILKCAACRLEWVEISLARDARPELPPREVQDAIKSAPFGARRRLTRTTRQAAEPTYIASRVAALIAALILIAVVIVLASSVNTRQPLSTTRDAPDFVAAPPVTPVSTGEEPAEEIAKPPEEEKKVKGILAPVPEKEFDVVQRPEPEPREEVVREEPPAREEVAHKPVPEPVKVPEKPEPDDSALAAAKKELPKAAPEVPSESDKVALKLARSDAEIFRKLYRNALFSVLAQEQELIKQARQLPKFDPILGRPVQPGAPVTPPASKPEAPKEEPTTNPNAPPPLPRIDKLRKEGKVPEQEPSSEPKQPDTPPPLPRIDKLRKEGKIPPAAPKEEPKPESTREDPKQEPTPGPKKGPQQPAVPKLTAPAGPVKRGIVQIPGITPEQLKKLAKAAGFDPVKVPGLKSGVILARADLTEDSTKKKVIHLFYYYGKTGFSVFERQTARTDKKDSYQAFYNGKGKTRTLTWAAGGREFVLVAQKFTKRKMLAIEASVRELFE